MAFRWGERNCSQQPFQTTTRGLFSITKFDALRFSAQLRLTAHSRAAACVLERKTMSLPNTASRAWLFIQFLLLWTFLMRAPLAAGQELSPPPQNRLALDVRSRLAEAARDVTLAPWQRTLMLDVACGRMEGTATEPSPVLPELALPTFGFAANDGVWNGFP